jgi:hypothetical protein
MVDNKRQRMKIWDKVGKEGLRLPQIVTIHKAKHKECKRGATDKKARK